jgi:hypothetical protein
LKNNKSFWAELRQLTNSWSTGSRFSLTFLLQFSQKWINIFAPIFPKVDPKVDLVKTQYLLYICYTINGKLGNSQ